MAQRQTLGRRDFIKVIAGMIGSLVALGIGAPSIAYLLSPSLRKMDDEARIDLGPLDTYTVGVPTRFEFTCTRANGWERTSVNHGLYVLRISETGVRVFSDICTHLGCRVTWHPEIRQYVSPCHDGHFDITGNVVSGPPPRPLDEYLAEIEAGHLFVTLPPFKRTG